MFFGSKVKYIEPLEYIDELKQTEHFLNFKSNNDDINTVIYAMNNVPETVYHSLYSKYSDVSNKYLQIDLSKNNTMWQIIINMDFYKNFEILLENETCRFIFIRLNIINKNKQINHVNSVIIDKDKKYVLIFEPKLYLLYDICIIKDQLNLPEDYKYVLASDLGYHYFNRLQKFDNYCQTYAFFVFLLIIENKDVNYTEFSKLFNTIITNKQLGYFLYHVKLNVNDINIENNQVSNWRYPSFIDNLLSVICFSKYQPQHNHHINYEIVESGDYNIISVIPDLI